MVTSAAGKGCNDPEPNKITSNGPLDTKNLLRV